MSGYRPRHHKYIDRGAVPDARDQILQRHQASRGGAVRPPVVVASDQVELAAAADIAPPIKPPVVTPTVAEPPADQPVERPYVPVRPRGVRVAALPTGTVVQIVESFLEGPATARVEFLTPEVTIVPSDPLITAPVDVVLPIESEVTPEPELTLEDLPIGKHDFEFLCGTAGTGKTWLAKKLLELAPEGSVVLCATTGIASVNLGEGTTINAFCKFFNTANLVDMYHTGQLQAVLRRHRGAGVRRILLDEVSMMDARQLTVLTRAIVEVNQPRDRSLETIGQDVEPEDGVQDGDVPPQLGLTLVGDFAQLPPVPDKKDDGEKIPSQFAFESPEWSRFAAHTTKLEKVRRQDNVAFVQALHAVRRGDVMSAMRFFTPEKFSATTDDAFNGSTVVATNVEVERRNQTYLDALTGDWLTVDARRWGKPRGDWKEIPDTLRLKAGAKVMILANRRVPDGPGCTRMLYANGDLGQLLGRHADGYWQVRLVRTGTVEKIMMITRENKIPLSPGRKKEIREYEQRLVDLSTALDTLRRWFRLPLQPGDAPIPNLTREIVAIEDAIKAPRSVGLLSDDGRYEIIGTIDYMPLRCAHACTVHKTQGLTLDRVQINIRDGFFKHPGMMFVALSRARTPEGLRIVGDPRGFMERCRVDQKVVPWL